MLTEVQWLCDKGNLNYIKEYCVFKAQLTAYTWLTCLKKVCAKVWSKEYYLVEQGLCKLKADKKKKSATETVYIAEVGSKFIQTSFPFYHISTIKQCYNNLYFDNH